MSKAVLISIRPKWCELIASGKKTIEVRKTAPKIPTPFKCYIYETRGFERVGNDNLNCVIGGNGRGMVIGEFVCKLIDTYTLHTTPNFYTDYYKTSPNGGLLYAVGGDDQTQIPEDELLAYGKGQNIYGWHISDLVIYDAPKKLSDFKRHDPTYDFAFFGEMDRTYSVSRPPQSWCYVEELT